MFAPTYFDSSGGTTFTITMIAGVIMYVYGWWSLIGFGREAPTAHPARTLYLLMGVLLTLAAVVLLIVGLAALG